MRTDISNLSVKLYAQKLAALQFHDGVVRSFVLFRVSTTNNSHGIDALGSHVAHVTDIVFLLVDLETAESMVFVLRRFLIQAHEGLPHCFLNRGWKVESVVVMDAPE